MFEAAGGGALTVYRDNNRVASSLCGFSPVTFLPASCRVWPATCLCPPRAVASGVLRQGLDTLVLVEAAGRYAGSVMACLPGAEARHQRPAGNGRLGPPAAIAVGSDPGP